MTKSFVLLGVILVLDIVLAANCGMMRQTLGLAKAVAGFSLLLALIALFTTPQGTLLVKEGDKRLENACLPAQLEILRLRCLAAPPLRMTEGLAPAADI